MTVGMNWLQMAIIGIARKRDVGPPPEPLPERILITEDDRIVEAENGDTIILEDF